MTADDGTFTGYSGTLTVIPGSEASVSVETMANGSGTVVAAQDVASGSTVTGFAISRDASGNFIANVAATWSLTSQAGGVLDGDLVASGDNLSAVFTGAKVGSAVMTADDGTFTGYSGTLTVIPGLRPPSRSRRKANGSGTVVAAQDVASGSSVTGYAISRDAYGNFIANVAATWSLTNITGGVVGGDLVASGDNKSAVFTGPASARPDPCGRHLQRQLRHPHGHPRLGGLDLGRDGGQRLGYGRGGPGRRLRRHGDRLRHQP